MLKQLPELQNWLKIECDHCKKIIHIQKCENEQYYTKNDLETCIDAIINLIECDDKDNHEIYCNLYILYSEYCIDDNLIKRIPIAKLLIDKYNNNKLIDSR